MSTSKLSSVALDLHRESLSSYSLPLHASSILLAQLENNVAEVFTPPNASVSPESGILSNLVLVLSWLLLLLCYSWFLPFLLPIRKPYIPNPCLGPKLRRSQHETGCQNRQRIAASCLPTASTPYIALCPAQHPHSTILDLGDPVANQTCLDRANGGLPLRTHPGFPMPGIASRARGRVHSSDLMLISMPHS